MVGLTGGGFNFEMFPRLLLPSIYIVHVLILLSCKHLKQSYILMKPINRCSAFNVMIIKRNMKIKTLTY